MAVPSVEGSGTARAGGPSGVEAGGHIEGGGRRQEGGGVAIEAGPWKPDFNGTETVESTGFKGGVRTIGGTRAEFPTVPSEGVCDGGHEIEDVRWGGT